MNVIKHVTTSVSKGIVTVQIECTSSEAARRLHRVFAEEINAGALVFDLDNPAASHPTLAERLAARDLAAHDAPVAPLLATAESLPPVSP